MESLSSPTAVGLLERPATVEPAIFEELQSQYGLADAAASGATTPTEVPGGRPVPAIEQFSLTDTLRDERMERMVRTSDGITLAPVKTEQAVAPEPQVNEREPKAPVADGLGSVALGPYTGAHRAERQPSTTLAEKISVNVSRRRHTGQHRYEGAHRVNAAAGKTANDAAETYIGNHRSNEPLTPYEAARDRTLQSLNTATRFTAEQLQNPKRRKKIAAVAALLAMGATMSLTGNDKPAPAEATPAVSHHMGTDASHNRSPQLTKVVIEKVAQISPRQEKVIDNLPGLDAQQKDNLTEFSNAVIKLKHKGTLKDINTDVMTAQYAQETGVGKSSLASKHHNFFGMKANHGWDGPKVKVMTFEYKNGKRITMPDYFRSYKNDEEGIKGYAEKLRTSPWYHDALGHPTDAKKTLDGLLNGNMAWATDPAYRQHIMERGKTLKVSDITKVELVKEIKHVVNVTPPQPAGTPEASAEGPVTIDWSKYNDRQRILETNPGKGAYIQLPDGKWVLSRTLDKDGKAKGDKVRRQIIEKELTETHVTPEGYQEFLKEDFKDLTGTVPKMMDNYDGKRNGMGTPKPNGVIERMVHHYTATPTRVGKYDGVKFAWTMQHSGPLGVQYNTDSSGNTYWLTKSRTSHVRGYNSTSFGNEIDAPEQAGVNDEQYESAIYNDVKFLTENGYINKNKPISKTVDKMMKGHHEMNPYGHNDFPEPVMDVIRGKLKNLLVQLGYKH